MGAGAGLALSRDQRLWVGLMEGTGLAGWAVMAAVAPHTEYSPSDAVVGALAALYGVYQGAGLSLLTRANDRQVAGAMMAAGAGGALVGSFLGRYLHLDATDTLMLLAGSAWGLWIGGWGASVLREQLGAGRNIYAVGVGTTAVATDAALIATSFAISKLVEMPPQRFAWISVSGGLGVVGGTAAAALSGGGSRRLKAGNVLGSLAGLTLGSVITGFIDFEPRRSGIETPSVVGQTSVIPRVEEVLPMLQVLPSERPGRPDDTRLLFSFNGRFR
jgi:hypothetical protein